MDESVSWDCDLQVAVKVYLLCPSGVVMASSQEHKLRYWEKSDHSVTGVNSTEKAQQISACQPWGHLWGENRNPLFQSDVGPQSSLTYSDSGKNKTFRFIETSR